MLETSTSAGRDEWLVALVNAFDATSKRQVAISAAIIAETEKHLRLNAHATALGSRRLH